MAVTYSQDLCDRVLAAYDRGTRTKQIAMIFNVSPALGQTHQTASA